MYSTDIMIDLETLGTTHTAAILCISAQGFDPFSDKITKDTFHQKITLESQPNRSIDESTLDFWSKQSQTVCEDMFSDDGRIDLKPALEQFTKFVWQSKRIWANGMGDGKLYDTGILEDAYKEYNMSYPWKFWQVLDTRTIYRITPGSPKLKNSHNSLEDCINQIELLRSCLQKIGITKFD